MKPINRSIAAASRSLTMAASLLAGLLAAPAPSARAQETLAEDTFTRGISVDAGRIYFADGQAEFCTSQRARSMSVGGGTITNLVNITNCPLTGVLKADGAYVFTATYHPHIVRHWSGGTSPNTTTIAMPTTLENSIQTIDTWGDWVYWASENAVGRVGRDGQNPLQVPRQTTLRPGMAVAIFFGSVDWAYWSEGNDGAGRIMRVSFGAPTPTVFAGGTFNSPAHLATDSTHLYWSETGGVIKRTTLSPGGAITTLRNAVAGGYTVNSLVVDDTHVYWLESTGGGVGRIFKVPKAGGTAVQVGPGNLSFANNLRQDADQLYWIETTNGDIRRIRKDAAAVQPDFTWLGLEVTQGIQNIANDVPIVSGKPTLIRGYASSTLANYPNVNAHLLATVNGFNLPGSPMRSSVATMTVPTDGSITDARRRNLASTFNWNIPRHWLDQSVTLIAVINHDNSISESNTSNNTLVRPLQVYSIPPICLKLRRTNAGGLVYEPEGSDFNRIIRRLSTLLPASDIWLYPQGGLFEELSCCELDFTPFYYGSWEVYEDSEKMIAQLIIEETFSSNPDECNDANAQTHRVAMISPGANTGSSTGFANYAWNVSWVKFVTGGLNAYDQPFAGATLAQELAHNYNGVFGTRWLHVNCGSPDGINFEYPYATNTIGPADPVGYYGYDRMSRSIIPPTSARDFMSYCGPTWVSDYNWRGLQDELGLTPISSAPPAPGDYLMAIGFVDEGQSAAQVQQVIRIPAGTIPMERLTQLLAEQTDRTSANPAYTVELRDSEGTLIRSLNIDESPMSHEHGQERRVFTALVQDDPPAASVSVVRRANNAVIGGRSASANAPIVTAITSPVGGTHEFNLTISWTASDPDGDPLTYIVQYSNDNGASWQTIAADIPQTSFSVDAFSLLPGNPDLFGGPNSRVRVIASDGFNSGRLASVTFTVPNRSPVPYITEPEENAIIPAGESIRFRGHAVDPEDGRLETGGLPEPLSWLISGPISVSGTGPELIVPNGLPPGTYSVSLTARDSSFIGFGSTSINIHVGDGAPPPSDTDADGAPDEMDNCPLAANADQADSDGDGLGDACDNCPMAFNPDQGDHDNNGIGNACDISRLYVNHAAAGAGTGLSWADAFTTLEPALAAAEATPTVAEIWIAQGRYVSTARTNPGDPRSATFTLRPGISLRGGFVGNEHSAQHANPRINRTILSGDMLGNDGPNFANRADNVYTVLSSPSGIGPDVVVDGLVISGGNATGVSQGGGAHLLNTSPTFRRTDFLSNQGGAAGGGGVYYSNPGPITFDRCRFLGNTAATSGGGVLLVGNGTPQFLNCLFSGNSVTGGGSSIGGAVAAPSANPTFVGCTIAGNSSAGLTGGVHIEGGLPIFSTGTFINCIAYANTDSSGSGSFAQIRAISPSVANVSYSCVQGGFAGPNISANPQFTDLDGADNILGTADDDARPAAGSPVNDAGANIHAFGMVFDLDGMPRLDDDPAAPDTGAGSAPIVDMGAHERPAGSTCPADWNGDTVVNSGDISAFLTSWLSSVQMGNLLADFNGDLMVNSGDISAFLTAWLDAVQNGC